MEGCYAYNAGTWHTSYLTVITNLTIIKYLLDQSQVEAKNLVPLNSEAGAFFTLVYCCLSGEEEPLAALWEILCSLSRRWWVLNPLESKERTYLHSNWQGSPNTVRVYVATLKQTRYLWLIQTINFRVVCICLNSNDTQSEQLCTKLQKWNNWVSLHFKAYI